MRQRHPGIRRHVLHRFLRLRSARVPALWDRGGHLQHLREVHVSGADGPGGAVRG